MVVLGLTICALGTVSEEGEEQAWTGCGLQKRGRLLYLSGGVWWGQEIHPCCFSAYETLAHSVLIFHYCPTSEMGRQRLCHVKTTSLLGGLVPGAAARPGIS